MKEPTSNDYAIILSYSTFSSLLSKKEQAWQWDDTSFPQMGEEGCGSRNPTRSLLIFYNLLLCLASSWMSKGEKGKKEEGGDLVSFALCLLLAYLRPLGSFLPAWKWELWTLTCYNVSPKNKTRSINSIKNKPNFYTETGGRWEEKEAMEKEDKKGEERAK